MQDAINEAAEQAYFDAHRAWYGSLTARDHYTNDLDRDALPGVPSAGKIPREQMELVRQFLDLHDAWDTHGYHMCGWSAPGHNGFNLHWQSCSYLDHDNWGATLSLSYRDGWKLICLTNPFALGETGEQIGWTEILSGPMSAPLERSEEFAEYLLRFKPATAVRSYPDCDCRAVPDA